MGLPQIGLQAVFEDAAFRRGFANYSQSVARANALTGQAAGGMSGKWATLGSGLVTLGGIAAGVAAGGLAALSLGALASAKTAISFESAWTGVTKTVEGLQDGFGKLTPEGKKLQDQFRALTGEIPRTHEELLKIAEIGGQMGIPREAMIDFTKVIAQLGDTTNLSTDEAAESLGHLSSIMGTVGREGTGGFEKLGNAIVALGNKFNGTERDIVSFADRIAGAGAVVGLTEGDVLGISTALVHLGIEAEAGGTAVQKVLLDINKSVTIGGDKLTKYAEVAGMTAQDFAAAWEKDAGSAFQAFVNGLSSQGDQAILTLQDLELNDARLQRAFLSLAASGGTLTDAMRIANEEFRNGSALTDEAAKRYATTDAQLKILRNNLRDIGITIGSILLPPLNQFLQFANRQILPMLSNFAKYIAEVISTGNLWNDQLSTLPAKFQPLVQSIGQVFLAFSQLIGGRFGDALKTLGVPPEVAETIARLAGSVLRFITEAVIPFVSKHSKEFMGAIVGIGAVLVGSGIVAAISAIIGAIAAIGAPVLALIGIAAALGAAWAGNWLGIRDIVTSVIHAVQPIIAGFVNAIRSFWQQHGADIQAFFIRAWELVQRVVGAVVATLGPIIQSFIQNIQANLHHFGPVLAAFKDLWVALQPVITLVLKVVGAALVGFGAVVTGVFGGISKAIGPFIAGFAQTIKGIVTLVTGIINVIVGFVTTLVGVVTGNTAKISEGFAKMSTGVKQIISGFVDFVIGRFKQMVEGTLGFVSGFVSGVTGFFDKLRGQAGQQAAGTATDVTAHFGKMSSTATATTKGMVTEVDRQFGDFRNRANQTMGQFGNDWTGHWQTTAKQPASIVPPMVDSTVGQFGSMRSRSLGEMLSLNQGFGKSLTDMRTTTQSSLGALSGEFQTRFSGISQQTNSTLTQMSSQSTTTLRNMTTQMTQTISQFGTEASSRFGAFMSSWVAQVGTLSQLTTTGFTTMRTNAVTQVVQMNSQLISAFSQLQTSARAATTALFTDWRNKFTQIRTTTQELMNQIIGATTVQLGQLRAMFQVQLANIDTLWRTSWTRMAQLLNPIWQQMRAIVTLGMGGIRSTMDSQMAGAVAGWSARWNQIVAVVQLAMARAVGIVQAAVGAIAAMVQQIEALAARAVAAAGRAASAAASAASSAAAADRSASAAAAAASRAAAAAASAGSSVGSSFNAGVRTGIASSYRPVQTTVVRQTTGIISGWKRQMGVESPSKVMAKLGAQLNAGLVQGLLGSQNTVNAALRSMVNRTIRDTRGLANMQWVGPTGGGGSSVTHIDRRTYLEMNPSYSQYQSPASVYLDASAALAAAR